MDELIPAHTAQLDQAITQANQISNTAIERGIISQSHHAKGEEWFQNRTLEFRDSQDIQVCPHVFERFNANRVDMVMTYIIGRRVLVCLYCAENMEVVPKCDRCGVLVEKAKPAMLQANAVFFYAQFCADCFKWMREPA